MSDIFLVRHGQASFGTDHYDRLSPTGFNQAEILARYWLRIGRSFDAVYSGEMERQIDTAQKVLACYREAGRGELELKILPEFNEYDSKSIFNALLKEMAKDDPGFNAELTRFYTDKKAFQRVFEKAVLRWINREAPIPGIVSWQDFRERVARGIDKVRQENGRGKRVLIFTSGGPISAAFQMATGISDAGTLRIVWHIINTSVSTFVYNNDLFSLTSFNSSAHLELEKNAGLITYR